MANCTRETIIIMTFVFQCKPYLYTIHPTMYIRHDVQIQISNLGDMQMTTRVGTLEVKESARQEMFQMKQAIATELQSTGEWMKPP